VANFDSLIASVLFWRKMDGMEQALYQVSRFFYARPSQSGGQKLKFCRKYIFVCMASNATTQVEHIPPNLTVLSLWRDLDIVA
jgi:hypothetical protein